MIVEAMVAVLFQGTPQLELAPGVRYDPSIPTLAEVVGHEFGEEITPPEGIAAYFRRLAEAAPDRTQLVQYATTWEGRPLHMLIIGSPERMARTAQIKTNLHRLADPRGLAEGEADQLIASLPVVTAFVHGVHGNEISSSGAAMAEAYHILAAQNDPRVDAILAQSIVIIDPAQNPDGRARFVFQTLMGRAAQPDPDPLSAEHDEPWPGGRSNHYLFDLNRDWFAQTQPESRGRVGLLLEWMPQVVVDLHEMGGNSTYYFPPPAVPGNPHTTPTQNAALDLFGRGNAAAFDRRGFAFFIREVFDSFYPGYGASWPLAHGAIGMTFEQASARGLAYRRNDGTVLTYHRGVVQHFTAAITTAETAARNRERMLREFYEFRRAAIDLGTQGPIREYLLPPRHDPGLVQRLALTLVANGIDVQVAEDAFAVDGRTLPAGTYVVPLAQPAGRLVRNLLDRHTAMDSGFIALQRERRANRLPDQIYDVTAWSMPLLWDVEAVAATRETQVATRPLTLEDTPSTVSVPPAQVGYLIPWNSTGAAATADLLQRGVRARAVGGEFVLDGRRYGVGAVLVRNVDNVPDVRSLLADAARAHGAEIVPVEGAYVDSGVSLGSNQVRALKTPRVLLVWDRPASSLSAGWARYILERRYGQPVTAIRATTLPRVNLNEFDVLVFPAGNYSTAVGGAQVERIRDWMRLGGTTIVMGESARWAARENVGLLATRTELRGGGPETGGSPPAASTPDQPITFLDAIQPARERPEQTPGAILTVTLDPAHWLSSGTDGEVGALVEGQRIFTPLTLDNGLNVGIYAPTDRMVASGIVWDEAMDQLTQKAFVMHQPVGGGHLIAFAEDPNYRAYAEATQLLFVNAVLFGPAF